MFITAIRLQQARDERQLFERSGTARSSEDARHKVLFPGRSYEYYVLADRNGKPMYGHA